MPGHFNGWQRCEVIDLKNIGINKKRTVSYNPPILKKIVSEVFKNDEIRWKVMEDMVLSDTVSIRALLHQLMTIFSENSAGRCWLWRSMRQAFTLWQWLSWIALFCGQTVKNSSKNRRDGGCTAIVSVRYIAYYAIYLVEPTVPCHLEDITMFSCGDRWSSNGELNDQ